MLLAKKKVLLICDSSSSFIVQAVKDGITDAGFECMTTEMSVKSLSAIQEKPNVIFLYLGEDVNKNSDVIVYIRDFCLEEEKTLFLVGYKSDIEEIKKVVPETIIGGSFARPIDAKAIGKELTSIIENIESSVAKKHILVVDDSGTMLRTIREWLSPKYKVSIVNSATSAISFLATDHPDLVLLDYEMPVCSGPQMLQMIRSEAKTANLPVIFLTSKGDRESVQTVLSLRPDGYLLKSMPSEKIISAVDNFFLTQKAKSIKA